MTAFTSNATGNWSSTSTWSPSGVPGNGDTVTIGAHTVTIDQNIGTSSNGIKQVVLDDPSAILQFSNAGSAFTVYFASTGTDPLGGGTQTNPTFASATMFGFYVARGSLNLQGNSTHIHTITSGDNTNPIYIHHGWGDLGNNVAATIQLSYLKVNHLGTNVTGMGGVYWYIGTTGTVSIDHCWFDDPFHVFDTSANSDRSLFSFTYNYITNARDHTVNFGVALQNGTVTVTDNTEITPAVSGKALLYTGGAAGPSSGAGDHVDFLRNALLADSTEKKLFKAEGGGSPTQFHTAQYNAGVLASVSSASIFYLPMSDAAPDIYRNMLMGLGGGSYLVITGFGTVTSGNGISQNWIRQSSNGIGINPSSDNGLSIQHNIIIYDSLPSHSLGIFISDVSGSNNIIKHNTIWTSNVTGTLTLPAIRISEVTEVELSCIVRDNLIIGGFGGIQDSDTNPSPNTYAADYAGAGVHHNQINGSSPDYTDNGGTNFTNGTNAHPNAVYGDQTGAVTFTDTTLTMLTFDTSLGGPGTYADLFAQFANRCGCTGTSYNSAFNLIDMWTYLMAGWVPTSGAGTASDNVSPSNGFIGALGVANTTPSTSDASAVSISEVSRVLAQVGGVERYENS